MQDQNRDEDIEYEYYNMNDDGNDVIRIFNSNKSHNQEIKTKNHNFFKNYEYQDYDDMGQKVIRVMPFLHFHLYLPRFLQASFVYFKNLSLLPWLPQLGIRLHQVDCSPILYLQCQFSFAPLLPSYQKQPWFPPLPLF